MATNYHAEHVGSLLRPPWLLDARSAWKQGTLARERLLEAEDRAALEAIELQRQAGMQIFTDGEVRRDTWMAGLLESTGGVVPAYLAPVPWHRDRRPVPGATVPGATVPGATVPDEMVPDEMVPDEETSFDTVAASEKVTRKAAHTSAEARFLAGHAPGQFKITMMSASMGGMIWQPGISDAVYPTPGDLVHDLVALQIEEIEGLIDQGVSWIQLDSLSYNQVFDPEFRAATGLAALSPERILDATIRADTELVGAAKRRNPDVTVAMHICRGNNRSAWMAQGSYEPVAERLFGEVGVDRFLLEYDTERAGGFAPLRFVRPGTTVVLGLVSTKQPQLEPVDELRRRIEEASRYVPIDDLALTPQCGFASTSRGNQLTVDEERRKLELVVRTAAEIWA